MDTFDHGIVLSYVSNYIKTCTSDTMDTALRWLASEAKNLKLQLPSEGRLSAATANRVSGLRPLPKIRRMLKERIAMTAHHARPSPLEMRLRWIAETLDLSRADKEILGLAVRAVTSGSLRDLLQSSFLAGGAYDEINEVALVKMLGGTREGIRCRLQNDAPLLTLGLIENRGGDDFAPSGTVLRIARLTSSRPERLEKALIGSTARPELGWSDFCHLGDDRLVAARILTAAFEARGQGVNLLFHGAPGSGKTEFAKTLARRLKARAVFVGESGGLGGEPSRADRISAYTLVRSITNRVPRTMLVVDEADEVFQGVDDEGSGDRRGSKVFINRLLETTDQPTIWITSHPERLGGAVLGRMTLALAFPQPGRRERSRMLKRMLRRQKFVHTEQELEQLAAIPAPPAVLDQAIRAGRMIEGSASDVERVARSVMRAMGGATRDAGRLGVGVTFDPALSSADTDLAILADRIAHGNCKAVSFCLYGLPGTGKSAYGRYLAQRMGLDVVEKRASDLLGPYVGQTEAQIAAAFQEAADKRAMLILDEADSLLRNRAGAHRSWEVSQVNEMLTWMERHPYPFVSTTNLMESLDPATLRRFVFKIQFLPMTWDQTRTAFRRIFSADAPNSLRDLSPLAPGDFDVVARRAAVLDERDPIQLAAMLAAEVAAKPRCATRPIGFLAA